MKMKKFIPFLLALCCAVCAACSGLQAVNEISLLSIYDDKKIMLPIRVPAYSPGRSLCGKAEYFTNDSEEIIVQKVADCGAEFFYVADCRFFTLQNRPGVFSLRVIENTSKQYENFVIIDDISCEFYVENASFRFPFPYFLCTGTEKENENDLIRFDVVYNTDSEQLKSVLLYLNIWEKQTLQNGFTLTFKDKSVSVIFDRDTVTFLHV